MKKLVWILLSIFFACRNDKPMQTFVSSTGLYKFSTEINQDKTDPTKYLCVQLNLFNKEGNKLFSLQTKVSDNMKWAIGWYPKCDTIVLNSKDVGVYAWRIGEDKKQLEEITISPEINTIADSIFKNKYQ